MCYLKLRPKMHTTTFLPAALYSGTLTAVLAVPAFEKPIDGLTDLSKAIYQGFTLGVMLDSSLEYIFKVGDTFTCFNIFVSGAYKLCFSCASSIVLHIWAN